MAGRYDLSDLLKSIAISWIAVIAIYWLLESLWGPDPFLYISLLPPAMQPFFYWFRRARIIELKLQNEDSGLYRISLDDQGFNVLTDDWEEFYPWSTLQEVDHDDDQVFLLGGKHITTIPSHAFESRDAFNSFIKEVSSYCTPSNNTSPNSPSRNQTP